MTDVGNVAKGSGGTPLPEGRTCSECRSFDRCSWLSSCKPDGRECDWDPSRFAAATEDERVDALQGQDLADAVAVEVMGWERILIQDSGSWRSWWCPVKGSWLAGMRASDWQPLSSWSNFGRAVDRMAATHHWTLRTPFVPGGLSFAGLTPHGVTGWNGRPDVEGSGPSLFVAGLRAALKAVRAKEGSA